MSPTRLLLALALVAFVAGCARPVCVDHPPFAVADFVFDDADAAQAQAAARAGGFAVTPLADRNFEGRKVTPEAGILRLTAIFVAGKEPENLTLQLEGGPASARTGQEAYRLLGAQMEPLLERLDARPGMHYYAGGSRYCNGAPSDLLPYEERVYDLRPVTP